MVSSSTVMHWVPTFASVERSWLTVSKTLRAVIRFWNPGGLRVIDCLFLFLFSLGTSINDVRRFSAIFDLSTYLSTLPCPITSNFGGYFGLTYPKIGRHLWTFPFLNPRIPGVGGLKPPQSYFNEGTRRHRLLLRKSEPMCTFYYYYVCIDACLRLFFKARLSQCAH